MLLLETKTCIRMAKQRIAEMSLFYTIFVSVYCSRQMTPQDGPLWNTRLSGQQKPLHNPTHFLSSPYVHQFYRTTLC